jgi:hypothetical protein
MAARARDVWPLLKNFANEYKFFVSEREALTAEDIEGARLRGIRANVVTGVLDGTLDCGEPSCRGRCHLKDPTRSKLDSACPNCDRSARFGVIGDGRPVKKLNVEGAPEKGKITAARGAVKEASTQEPSTAVIVKTAEMKRKEFFLAVKKQVQADKVKMSIAAEQRQEEEERKTASPAELRLSEACIGGEGEVGEVFRVARFMTAMREHKVKVAIEAERLRLEAKYGILAGRKGPKGKCSRPEDKFQDDSDSCDSTSSEGGSSGYEGS